MQCHAQSMEFGEGRQESVKSQSYGDVVQRRKKGQGWLRCAEASRKVFKKPNTKADYMPLFMLPLD